MNTTISFGFFDLWILLGVFQGLFISWFFIASGQRERKANLYQGMLMLFLSLGILEELLNNTGLIVRVLAISNYAEPFNFAYAPLFYLLIKSSLDPGRNTRYDWLNFIPMILWALYMIFYFIQPDDFKYNSYLSSKHPDWPYLDVVMKMNDDPLGIRRYVNLLTGIHFTVYMLAALVVFVRKLHETGQAFFRIKDQHLRLIRNSSYHFIAIIVIFIFTKLYFGRDLGDYFIASYISFMIFATSYQIIRSSNYFETDHSFLEFPIHKYRKSSLTKTRKKEILEKIIIELETNKYHTSNLASLSDLAKRINETSHHVSQVMNEEMNQSFFELLASYRVKEAKEIISKDKEKKLTVEEIAEQVGYNSKSSFNKAFKNNTGQTPSDFRNSLNNS
jgi:AraC-like DNA-binding protein